MIFFCPLFLSPFCVSYCGNRRLSCSLSLSILLRLTLFSLHIFLSLPILLHISPSFPLLLHVYLSFPLLLPIYHSFPLLLHVYLSFPLLLSISLSLCIIFLSFLCLFLSLSLPFPLLLRIYGRFHPYYSIPPLLEGGKNRRIQ